LGLDYPYVAMLSVVGAKDYLIRFSTQHIRAVEHYIDRDALILPAQFIDTPSTSPASVLRDVFDTLWQSVGYSESCGYREDGSRLDGW